MTLKKSPIGIQNFKDLTSYLNALTIALIVHVILFLFLLYKHSPSPTPTADRAPIMRAIAVTAPPVRIGRIPPQTHPQPSVSHTVKHHKRHPTPPRPPLIHRHPVAHPISNKKTLQKPRFRPTAQTHRLPQPADPKATSPKAIPSPHSVSNPTRALDAPHMTAAMLSALSHYEHLIVQRIGQFWLIPEGVDHTASAQLLIELTPTGEVKSVIVTRSSGNERLDRSARAAVLKASPLPVPDDPNLFDKFRSLSLTVKPER